MLLSTIFLKLLSKSEEEVGDGDGGDGAGDVGEEGVAGGVACLGDAYRAEVDGEDVEGGVGRASDGGGEFANEGVCAVGLHHVEHHSATATSAKRFHEHCGQCSDPLRVEAKPCNKTLYPACEYVESPGGAEHSDRHEYCDEVGDDHDSSLETLFRSFDEDIVYTQFAAYAGENKGDDYAEEDEVRTEGAVELHFLRWKIGEEIGYPANKNGYGAKPAPDHAVHADALLDA